MEPEDRLTILPATLITAILSLIPLKDAVKTSILARGWRYTWQSTSNIEINQSNFTSLQKCLHFAYKWLKHYPQPTIDRFFLTLTTTSPNVDIHPFLQALVNFALNHQTKTLELDLPGPIFDLPETIYDYDLLDHLKLYKCNFTPQKFVNISWLKTAALGGMAFKNDALRDLLTECPLLESLSLVECVEATEFTVVSSKLRSLVVERCLDLLDLTVFAPELRRVKFVGALIGFRFLHDLRMLEEADIDLRYSPYHDEDSGELVRDLLISLKHAPVLTVCSYITQVLATSNPWKLARNIKVKHLILNSALNEYEFIGIACFLRSSPWLTKIQFELGPNDIYVDQENNPTDELDMETFWGEDLGGLECLKTCLNEVEINGYGGSDNEMRFMHFLFKFGVVLRTFRVRVARDDAGVWRNLVPDISMILETWRCEAGSGRDIDITVE